MRKPGSAPQAPLAIELHLSKPTFAGRIFGWVLFFAVCVALPAWLVLKDPPTQHPMPHLREQIIADEKEKAASLARSDAAWIAAGLWRRY